MEQYGNSIMIVNYQLVPLQLWLKCGQQALTSIWFVCCMYYSKQLGCYSLFFVPYLAYIVHTLTQLILTHLWIQFGFRDCRCCECHVHSCYWSESSDCL